MKDMKIQFYLNACALRLVDSLFQLLFGCSSDEFVLDFLNEMV